MSKKSGFIRNRVVIPAAKSFLKGYKAFNDNNTVKEIGFILDVIKPVSKLIKDITVPRNYNESIISYNASRLENTIHNGKNIANALEATVQELTGTEFDRVRDFMQDKYKYSLDTTVHLLLIELVKTEPSRMKLLIEQKFHSHTYHKAWTDKEETQNNTKSGIWSIDLGLQAPIYVNGTNSYFKQIMLDVNSGITVNMVCEQVFAISHDTFWKDRGNQIALMSSEAKSFDDSDGNNNTYILEDRMIEPQESEIADKILGDCKKYIQKGKNKCFLLYGPPGTGKTTAVQKIVTDLNERSVRLTLEYLSRTNLPRLYAFLRVLRPTVLILDDFDRLPNQNIYLDMFQELRRFVPIVLLTANDITKLNTAIKRPGRIDRVYTVLELDDKVLRKVLNKFWDQTPETIKKMPISFVQEFADRAEEEGIEEAIYSFEDLWTRFDENIKEWNNISKNSQNLPTIEMNITGDEECYDED